MDGSKIDILLINDSKLDSTIHDSDVYIPGLEILRNDRGVNGRKGGVVCIFCAQILTIEKVTAFDL